MTVQLQQCIDHGAALRGTRYERLAQRCADMCATDPEFVAAQPIPEIIEAACRPGVRLAEMLQTLVNGYADRAALGQRAREVVRDPVTGRRSARLLPRFDTISYRELWQQVHAIASAWHRDPAHSLRPGDFVATMGFASSDYLAIDLVCAYLGLVSVPLQHGTSVSQLQPVIDDVEPRVLAVSAAYLDRVVESALASASLRHVLVFDYQAEVDDQREAFQRAQDRLQAAGVPVVLETIHEVIARGRVLPPKPAYAGGTEERLAMIMYTSGSTGAPKGAMYTEAMVSRLWTASLAPAGINTPVIGVNFLPLNHIAGRLFLASSFRAGGINYFVPEPDLSTLFEDWAIARPTEMGLVPRVVEMLHQRYRAAVDRSRAGGAGAEAEAAAAAELREQLLGGRVLSGLVGSAPLAAEMKAFIESALDVDVFDMYGPTEVGAVTRDGVVIRPPVIDYKLIDVPELGYFRTDKPYPRGELLVKSLTAMPGYYKRPEATAKAFDADGYYRTGDVVAEIAHDHLAYVDRSKNVVKLAQGEFVAVANLEAVFARASLVRQIFVYANSERSYLLAVIVPTPDALRQCADDAPGLKALLRESLRETAKAAELQSHEVPSDFLIEVEPFTAANGLLSGVGKLLRGNLTDRYGVRLEQLYVDVEAARSDELRTLHAHAADLPTVDTLTQAARALLGSAGDDLDSDAPFTDMGGDSLSALSFSNLLADIFGVEVPVATILDPGGSLRQLATFVENQQKSQSLRPTSGSVHGRGAKTLRASDIRLERFIDDATLTNAVTLPRTTGEPHTVLLTGANGYLGRFLALQWLQRVSRAGGRVICIVRGSDSGAARTRLMNAFDSGDPKLSTQIQASVAEHLEVVAGDIDQPNLGLDRPTWERLANSVDLIVHAAALVNHVLPYEHLFGPNVVGTAEVIRLAITTRIKPVSCLSTVAVGMSITAGQFTEDDDIRAINPVRSIDGSYANGYATSKWAAEVLLREAHDLCALPVAVFRSDMMLAHSDYAGQLNLSDAFTRLLFSLLVTGIAPRSFYRTRDGETQPRAHYDGLPVDFVAESVTELGAQTTAGYRCFNVMNPHDDGISLDTFVDWLIESGNDIRRIEDYNDWFIRFENALKALPEKQRQQSSLPLLHAYGEPQEPLRGAPAPTVVFRSAVRAAEIGVDNDIPHVSPQLIDQYVTGLRQLCLIAGSPLSGER
jgi:fatty acid CoA ligase FadD9